MFRLHEILRENEKTLQKSPTKTQKFTIDALPALSPKKVHAVINNDEVRLEMYFF